MNPGKLNRRATLLGEQTEKTDIGSAKKQWAELESLMVGRVSSDGRALDLSIRAAHEIEVVYESRMRDRVTVGRRLAVDGVVFDIVRVDSVRNDRCLIYCKRAT